jgi:hypothetical protein
VAPGEEADQDDFFLSNQHQLEEVCQVYKIEEIIFCSRDIPAERIMYWMSRLGPRIAYKTVPEEGLSIIGSHSRHTVGELYTVDIYFAIDQPSNRRNKRLLDIALSALGLLISPVLLLIRPARFLPNARRLWDILSGRRSWVGYAPRSHLTPLPKLKPGLFNPADGLPPIDLNEQMIRRLNFHYAKDYHLLSDLEIIGKALFSKRIN